MHRCVFSSSKWVESSLRYPTVKQTDRGELTVCFVFVWLCCARHISRVNNRLARRPPFSAALRGSRRPFLPLKTPGARFPGRHLSLSLSLRHHSDIPKF